MRLAHKILTQPPVLILNGTHDDDHAMAISAAKRCIPKGPVIFCTPVAQFINSHKQWWEPKRDIPNAAPPWDHAFYEWERLTESPEMYQGVNIDQCGVLVVSTTDEDLITDLWRKSPCEEAGDDPLRFKWAIRLTPFMSSNERPFNGGWCYGGESHLLLVCPDGSIGFAGHSPTEGIHEVVSRNCGFQILVAAFAQCFVHCKNVEQVDASERLNPSRKVLRRTKSQPLIYRVLKIDGFASGLDPGTEGTEQGAKKALHLVRGNFAKYTEESPLFGKVTGTFWRPMHTRGSEKRGRVVKDYAVSPRRSDVT